MSEPSSKSTEPFHFAQCVLDVERRTLTRNGNPVVIQEQILELLCFLVSNRGRTVTKDELVAKVWSNADITDSAVARAVMKARQAVGDDGQAQKIIRTAYGKGFVFVAEVSRQTESSNTEQVKPRRWLGVAVLAGILVAAAGIFFAITPYQRATTSLVVGEFANRTSDEALDWVQLGLGETVSHILQTRTRSIRLLGQEDLQTLDLETADVTDVQTMLGAEWAVDGELHRDRERYVLRYRVFGRDVSGGAETREIAGPDIGLLIRQLSDDLVRRITDDVPAAASADAPLGDPLVLELYGRALNAFYRGNFSQAREIVEAALAITPDDPLLTIALLETSIAGGENNADIRSRLADIVQSGDPDFPDTLKARALRKMGIETWYAGDVDAARSLLAEAERFAARSDDPILTGMVANSMAVIHASARDFDASVNAITIALEQFRIARSPYHESLALANLGYTYDTLGNVPISRQYQEKALALRVEYGFSKLITASSYALGRALRRSGQFAQAERQLLDAIDVSRAQGWEINLFDALEELAELRMAQGRLDDAQAILLEAQQIAQRNDDILGEAWVQELTGRLLMIRGHYEPAVSLLRRSVATQVEQGERSEAVHAQIASARALMESGELEEAEAILRELATSREQLTPDSEVTLLHEQARLHWLREESDQARAAYLNALLLAEARGVVDREASVAVEFATFLIDHSELDEAREQIDRALIWSRGYAPALTVAETLKKAS